MLPNCQAGTKKNDLTTPVDTPHKVRERKLTLILDHFEIGIDKKVIILPLYVSQKLHSTPLQN